MLLLFPLQCGDDLGIRRTFDWLPLKMDICDGLVERSHLCHLWEVCHEEGICLGPAQLLRDSDSDGTAIWHRCASAELINYH